MGLLDRLKATKDALTQPVDPDELAKSQAEDPDSAPTPVLYAGQGLKNIANAIGEFTKDEVVQPKPEDTMRFRVNDQDVSVTPPPAVIGFPTVMGAMKKVPQTLAEVREGILAGKAAKAGQEAAAASLAPKMTAFASDAEAIAKAGKTPSGGQSYFDMIREKAAQEKAASPQGTFFDRFQKQVSTEPVDLSAMQEQARALAEKGDVYSPEAQSLFRKIKSEIDKQSLIENRTRYKPPGTK